MKWGERNYQYEDGSLTPLGRLRYGVGDSSNFSSGHKDSINTYRDWFDRDLRDIEVDETRSSGRGYETRFLDDYEMTPYRNMFEDAVTKSNSKLGSLKIAGASDESLDRANRILTDNIRSIGNALWDQANNASDADYSYYDIDDLANWDSFLK